VYLLRADRQRGKCAGGRVPAARGTVSPDVDSVIGRTWSVRCTWSQNLDVRCGIARAVLRLDNWIGVSVVCTGLCCDMVGGVSVLTVGVTCYFSSGLAGGVVELLPHVAVCN